MITRSDLRKTAREYLQSAEVLRANRKYDMSVYLCGYAVEIALKERICRTLKWPGYPATSGEFSNYRSFQTHNLAVLLNLTAIESKVITALSGDWSIVETWNPEQRYSPRGIKTMNDADKMISATTKALRAIL